jgi:hypothetical protein
MIHFLPFQPFSDFADLTYDHNKCMAQCNSNQAACNSGCTTSADTTVCSCSSLMDLEATNSFRFENLESIEITTAQRFAQIYNNYTLAN